MIIKYPNKKLDSINVYPLKVKATAICKSFAIDNWARWVSVDVRCTTEEVVRRWDSVEEGTLSSSSRQQPPHRRHPLTSRGQAGIKQQMTEMPHIGAHIQQYRMLLFYPKTFLWWLCLVAHWWNDCMFYHLYSGLVFKMRVMYWWTKIE